MKAELDALIKNINLMIFDHLAKGKAINIDLVGTLVPKNCFVKNRIKSIKKVITLQNDSSSEKLTDMIKPLSEEAGLDSLEVFNNWHHTCLISNSNEISIFKIEDTLTIIINKKEKTVEILASKALQKYLNPMNIPDEKVNKRITPKNKSIKYYIMAAVVILLLTTIAVLFEDVLPEKQETTIQEEEVIPPIEKNDLMKNALESAEKELAKAKEDEKNEKAKLLEAKKSEIEQIQTVSVTPKKAEVVKQPTAKPVKTGVNSHLPSNTRFLVLGSFLSGENAEKLKKSLTFKNNKVYIGQKGRMNLVMIELEGKTTLTPEENQIKNDYEGSWYFMNK